MGCVKLWLNARQWRTVFKSRLETLSITSSFRTRLINSSINQSIHNQLTTEAELRICRFFLLTLLCLEWGWHPWFPCTCHRLIDHLCTTRRRAADYLSSCKLMRKPVPERNKKKERRGINENKGQMLEYVSLSSAQAPEVVDKISRSKGLQRRAFFCLLLPLSISNGNLYLSQGSLESQTFWLWLADVCGRRGFQWSEKMKNGPCIGNRIHHCLSNSP